VLSELQDAEVFSKVRKLVAILVLVIAVAVPWLAALTAAKVTMAMPRLPIR